MYRLVFILPLLCPASAFAEEIVGFAAQEKLLDKAKAALVWFQDMGTENARKRVPAAVYREHLLPADLIRTAAMLVPLKTKETKGLAEDLGEMLFYYQLTPEECCALEAEFGDNALPLLSGNDIAVGTIYIEAETYLKEGRNSAEKVVLHKEPKNALELMKAVDVLSVTGRPMVVRYYLRKFLRDKDFAASPEEAAKIVETIGSPHLMQLARNPLFEPLGKEVALKIMALAPAPPAQNVDVPVPPSAPPPVSFVPKPVSAEQLRSTGGKPSPLVQMVNAKDRRVRFAALEAIMSLKPAEPFAGSSSVIDALTWFAKGDGKKKIAVGHIRFDEANQTASMLMSGGYQTGITVNCADLFHMAAASPDVELVFVDARCPKPVVGEFVQKMYQDARTAEIPIAVLTNEKLDPLVNLTHRRKMDAFDRINPDGAFRNSLSLNYPSPADKQAAAWIRDDLIVKSGIEVVPPQVRLEQAKWALGRLKEIALQNSLQRPQKKVFDAPDLGAAALEAIQSEMRIEEGLELAAAIKEPAMQWTLYDAAANRILLMDTRQHAAICFRQSLDRFGILFRGEQLRYFYDRYNASESEPKEAQQLLSGLIDAVEEKVKRK